MILRVACSNPNAPMDIAHLLSDVQTPIWTLSDEHAQSSYGLPVIVDEDDNAYGPSEVPSLSVMIDDQSEIPDLLWRAKAAGYSVSVLRPSESIGTPGRTL